MYATNEKIRHTGETVKRALQGIDSTKYVDKAARVGTLIHSLVEAHITKKEVDLSDYTQLEMEMANVGFYKYLDWEKQHTVEPIFNEKQFVSEKFKYGGTLDFYCKVDGKKTLIDFKSGKGIFNEHFLQVSSYANLLTENGYKVEQIMILNIGRNEDEPFDHKEIKKPIFVNFYEGKQWAAPTKNTKNLPRPVVNIVKMICRSKKSAILSTPVKIIYKAENESADVEKFNNFAAYIQKEIGQDA